MLHIEYRKPGIQETGDRLSGAGRSRGDCGDGIRPRRCTWNGLARRVDPMLGG